MSSPGSQEGQICHGLHQARYQLGKGEDCLALLFTEAEFWVPQYEKDTRLLASKGESQRMVKGFEGKLYDG